MEFLQDIFSLIGRVLISGMFLWAAYEKMKNWNATVTYMKTKNIPYLNIILPIGVALKIIGGLSVLLGWHAHIGALLLLIVAISACLKMHDFWRMQGEERNMEEYIYRLIGLKNFNRMQIDRLQTIIENKSNQYI